MAIRRATVSKNEKHLNTSGIEPNRVELKAGETLHGRLVVGNREVVAIGEDGGKVYRVVSVDSGTLIYNQDYGTVASAKNAFGHLCEQAVMGLSVGTFEKALNEVVLIPDPDTPVDQRKPIQ